MESQKKIIFLDFDGVLNNMNEMMNDPNSIFKQLFSYKNMECLQKLIKNTDAKIVLTTSHRYGDLTLAVFDEICKLNFISGRVIDRTKDLYLSNRDKSSPEIRVLEIREWLERHPSYKHWVVLDDMNMNIENFIKTNIFNGLTMDDVEQAKKILNC